MSASVSNSDLTPVGRVGAAYGVRGWVKVISDTDPPGNILEYTPWHLPGPRGLREFEVEGGQFQDKYLIAKLVGVDDRETAKRLTGSTISVSRSCFPELPSGEYYWTDLIGLSVIDQRGRLLGRVSKLIETGVHDVLVVEGDQELLIPYVKGRYVKSVDLERTLIEVEWDTDS